MISLLLVSILIRRVRGKAGEVMSGFPDLAIFSKLFSAKEELIDPFLVSVEAAIRKGLFCGVLRSRLVRKLVWVEWFFLEGRI